MTINYPLAVPSWDEDEYSAIRDVVESGMFTMGSKVRSFEKDMAQFLGSKFCVMVNSGSSANLLMIASLFYGPNKGLKRGDEVIVPAISWSTTYFPLHQYGLHMRFVDVDAGTLNFDLGQLEDGITDQTKAILAVNLLGNPNDFAAIRSLIGDRDIILLEDNCESLGATFNSRQAGTFGVMGTFSTFFSHHMSTMEGGVVVTDDESLYHTLLCMRAHGWTRNLPKDNHLCGELGDDAFLDAYRFVLPGYNVRPLEMSGAIGVEQLRKLPGFVAARRENASRFRDRCGNISNLRLQEEIGESSWFGFSIVIEPSAKFSRPELLNVLREADIEVRPIVGGNFANSEAIKWFDWSTSGELVNADYVGQHGFMVGNHHYPLDAEIEWLGKALERAVG